MEKEYLEYMISKCVLPDIFKDPIRAKILLLLEPKPLFFSEIWDYVFEQTEKNSAAHHLRVLKDNEMISRELVVPEARVGKGGKIHYRYVKYRLTEKGEFYLLRCKLIIKTLKSN